MASRLAVPKLRLGSLSQDVCTPKALCADTPGSIKGHCGSHSCRFFGATTPASIMRPAMSACSPVAGAPGFGLARARSTKPPAVSGFGLPQPHRRSRAKTEAAADSTWMAELRQVGKTCRESREWLRSTCEELADALHPPSQLRSAWHTQAPGLAPLWLCWLCGLCLFAGMALLVAAFVQAPSAACPDDTDIIAYSVLRVVHVLLTSMFMFGAGALLAVEHPVRWMMLRIL